MTDNNHTFHELINAVDDIKEKISDNQYKHLVETIGLLKKKEKKFVLVNYIKTKIKYPGIDCNCCDEEPRLDTEEREDIFLIDDDDEYAVNFLCKDVIRVITSEVLDKWSDTKIYIPTEARNPCNLILLDYHLL